MFPFKSLFRTPAHGRPVREPLTEARAEQAEPNTLITYTRVAERLERIRKARCLLIIKIPGETQTFSSALLRVSSLEHYVLIDELVPRFGNDLLAKGTRITATAYFQGVIHDLETRVLDVGAENNVPIFRLDLPAQLSFSQRRRHHRAQLPAGASVPVHCMVGPDRLIRGEIQNISVGGLCFQLDKRHARAINVGDIIKRCVIEPSPGERIEAALEVRNTSMLTPQSNQRRVGAKFLELDAKTLSRVQHLVVALEREEIREQQNWR
jgi:c-di-GMP-binding flagellar brake protein YcgR